MDFLDFVSKVSIEICWTNFRGKHKGQGHKKQNLTTHKSSLSQCLEEQLLLKAYRRPGSPTLGLLNFLFGAGNSANLGQNMEKMKFNTQGEEQE